MNTRTAILLLAHGTPGSPDDVPAYLQNITAGRAVPPEVMREVRHRYERIGTSPLTAISLAQSKALAASLGIPVYVGMRNWHPYIAAAVAQMITDGVEHVIALCLAPQNSRTSVGLYKRALFAAAAGRLRVEFIDAWHDQPALVAAFAEKLRARLTPTTAAVIFTAHSVPCRTILTVEGPGDPYSVQAKQTAARVAAAAGVTDGDWCFAFQSQGMSGGPWIGPTVEDTIRALHAAGHRRLLVQPIGFVCDHVEVLYDIDIAFRELAATLGMTLERAESLNDSPAFIAALAATLRPFLGAAR